MKKTTNKAITVLGMGLGVFLITLLPAKAGIDFRIEVGTPQPPPPMVFHTQPFAPSPHAVWVEPHYEWRHRGWVWVPGRYIYPPSPGMTWVEPRYEKRGGHYYWNKGYWKNGHGKKGKHRH